MPNELYEQLKLVNDRAYINEHSAIFACFYELIIKTELLIKHLTVFKVHINKEDLTKGEKGVKANLYDKLSVLHKLIDSQLTLLDMLQISKYRNSLAHDFSTALKLTKDLKGLVEVLNKIDIMNKECESLFFNTHKVTVYRVTIVQDDNNDLYEIILDSARQGLKRSNLFT